ncbi:uncharacterized protein cubi_01524 [Cryptosporidium ubiquitum]|uniref:Uncharacterized protein n=1 Tax=Cryptosporidium ubiquitum TaxID=857276 RepID=A0A1J4MDX2_9CRYT|nr:uncharacterized protein cubi_01524 [Cryptosporidium ubiquitum]OII72191.1 hypothetical protein cubi_01524 [Cryptosporidium ubiquitum]
MRLYCLFFIYLLSFIQNDVFESSGDSRIILSLFSSSLLKLSTNIEDGGGPDVGVTSEFQRLSLMELDDIDTTESDKGNLVTVSFQELLSLRSRTLTTLREIKTSYLSLVDHPIDEKCVGSVTLIYEVCALELDANNSICKLLKKILRRVKKVERNYSAMIRKYSGYNREILSALFDLNSLMNTYSRRVELKKSYLVSTEKLLRDVSLFFEGNKGFTSFIISIYTQFCSVGGITYYTNKVDQEIQLKK